MYAFSDWVISLFEKNGIVLKHNRSTYVYGLRSEEHTSELQSQR